MRDTIAMVLAGGQGSRLTIFSSRRAKPAVPFGGIYRIIDIPGITCVKPHSALYLFPKIDTKKFRIKDDQQFILDLLLQEHVLLVQGTGFSWPKPDHFRIVFLPRVDDLAIAIDKLAHFLSNYHQ